MNDEARGPGAASLALALVLAACTRGAAPASPSLEDDLGADGSSAADAAVLKQADGRAQTDDRGASDRPTADGPLLSAETDSSSDSFSDSSDSSSVDGPPVEVRDAAPAEAPASSSDAAAARDARLRGQALFDELRAAPWQEAFSYTGSADWKAQWFLDGTKASFQHGPDGMTFCAGPTESGDAFHAVLWTKPSFSGAVKVEYDYTRTDRSSCCVNILYLQATGINRARDGKTWPTDIAAWSDRRTNPAMSLYFKYMEALHISYGSFDGHVRARRYPVAEGDDFETDTRIPPDFPHEDLFAAGETYHITAIKEGHDFLFHARGTRKEKLYAFDSSAFPLVKEGRIGLRHMHTRCARYRNFTVSVPGAP